MKIKNKKIRKNIDLDESVVGDLDKLAKLDLRTIKSFMEKVLIDFVNSKKQEK